MLASLLVASVAACGPSFQAVYECDVKFEHCYAMDENPVSREAKRECWRTWLHAYTFGQPRDRVEYATTRVTQLSLDPSALAEAADDGGLSLSTSAAAAPVPTSAFAPPPNVPRRLTREPPAARGDHRRRGCATPGADCADACTQPLGELSRRVRGPGATPATHAPVRTGRSPAASATGAYKICVPACFRDAPVSANTARRAVR